MTELEIALFATCAWFVLGCVCAMAPRTKGVYIELENPRDLWKFLIFAPGIFIIIFACYMVDLEDYWKGNSHA